MPITKFFRVAQSGPTIDGRTITPAQIDQMARSYDRQKYGARVNLEHILSMYPDSVFKAYGDVVAVKADNGPDGTRVLLAQIDAHPDLIKLKQDGQKAYWSVEINPNFAGTGEAYLVGLAATDNPASMGTEALAFCATKDPDRVKANLYSAVIEAPMELDDTPPPGPNIVDKVKALFSNQNKANDGRFAQHEQAMEAMAAELGKLSGANFARADDVKSVAAKLEKLGADLSALTTKLSNTPDQPAPPKHAGGGDTIETDC